MLVYFWLLEKNKWKKIQCKTEKNEESRGKVQLTEATISFQGKFPTTWIFFTQKAYERKNSIRIRIMTSQRCLKCVCERRRQRDGFLFCFNSASLTLNATWRIGHFLALQGFARVSVHFVFLTLLVTKETSRKSNRNSNRTKKTPAYKKNMRLWNYEEIQILKAKRPQNDPYSTNHRSSSYWACKWFLCGKMCLPVILRFLSFRLYAT